MANCPIKYVEDEQGCRFIAPSQRPDGTWRKSRRVKDGYVPQEEVPLYESKGKKFIQSKPLYPPGYTPDIKETRPKKQTTVPIPGLGIDKSAEGKTNKKKKKKNTNNQQQQQTGKVESASEKQMGSNLTGTPSSTSRVIQQAAAPAINPEKRIKNLRKRLREIEVIQEKINSGTLKNPEQDQLEKISRKTQVEFEIEELTALLNIM